MESCRAADVTKVVELGPGNALARMIHEFMPESDVHRLSEFHSLSGFETLGGDVARRRTAMVAELFGSCQRRPETRSAEQLGHGRGDRAVLICQFAASDLGEPERFCRLRAVSHHGHAGILGAVCTAIDFATLLGTVAYNPAAATGA
jgi:hypothetical protein